MNVDELFVRHFKRKRKRSTQLQLGKYSDRVEHFTRLGYSKPEAMKRAGENR